MVVFLATASRQLKKVNWLIINTGQLKRPVNARDRSMKVTLGELRYFARRVLLLTKLKKKRGYD